MQHPQPLNDDGDELQEKIIQHTYKHIHFNSIAPTTPGKRGYMCRNHHSGEMLGQVQWFPRWRQYCYFDETNAGYSQSCLTDIAHFLSQLN